MKKTLLATAIAGAAFVSAGAQAATVYNEDGTKLDLYGNVQLAYKSIKDEAGHGKDEIFDNGSRIGFAGEHLITRDLAGYFKAEFRHKADEARGAGGGINEGDESYLGLKGNFGDLRVGSWDTLIDDWIQDPITDNEYFDVTDSSSRIVGKNDLSNREGNKVSFISPSFSGFRFAVGTQFDGDAEELSGANVELSDKAGNPRQADIRAKDSSSASFFGGVEYTAGAFSIAAVYDDLNNYDGSYNEQTDTGSGYTDTGVNGNFDLGKQYGITAQYTVDTLRMALKLERFESDNDFLADTNYYGLGARYGYGRGDIYGAYQYVDVGGDSFSDTLKDSVKHGDWPNEREDDSYNEIVLGATYNLSDSMYTFVEGALYDRDDHEDDGVAVGAVYMF